MCESLSRDMTSWLLILAYRRPAGRIGPGVGQSYRRESKEGNPSLPHVLLMHATLAAGANHFL